MINQVTSLNQQQTLTQSPSTSPTITPCQNAPKHEKSSSNKMLIGLLGGITIILLILVIVFFAFKKDDNIRADATQTDMTTEIVDSTQVTQQSSSAEIVDERQAYVINDADGWTNIRTSPSSKSAIVDKVYDGTVFYISPIPSSKWCKFYWDINGQKAGYIYSKYIKPAGSSKTPPNQHKYATNDGKYHIIISSHKTYSDALTRKKGIEGGDSEFTGEIIYSSSQNVYRVSVYSSYSKSDAKQQLQWVRDYWPNAWISSD